MAHISERLERWLEVLVRRSGSDLFLVVGLPPAIRVTGRVIQLDEDPDNQEQKCNVGATQT